MTVTAVDPCAPGFLTVFDCAVRPMTSNVNYVPGRNTAGLVFVAPAADGKVCVATYATTDVVVDVIGSFGGGGDGFHPFGPRRWIDTRGGPALLTSAAGARTTGMDTTVRVAGVDGVPAGATAVWVNLTIADPTAPTVLTAYPGSVRDCAHRLDGQRQGRRSRPRPARSSDSVPTERSASHTVAGSSGVVLDIAGWFGPGGLRYQPLTPTRLVDTRTISPTAPGRADGHPRRRRIRAQRHRRRRHPARLARRQAVRGHRHQLDRQHRAGRERRQPHRRDARPGGKRCASPPTAPPTRSSTCFGQFVP